MISKTINVWKEDQYPGKSNDGFIPKLNTYILGGNKKRPAILICPGGGYAFCSDREAEAVALQFNAVGFHAFVLYYSVTPRKYPVSLLDLSKSMGIIREHADEWNIDNDKVAVCGFSAGGHLAASLGVYWERPDIQSASKIEKGTNKPNALILGYPVITSGEFAHRGSFDNLLSDPQNEDLLNETSLELHVNENTPPTFLWHTYEDSAVPIENSLLFAKALRKYKIPFELHIYPKGPHGLSLATEETQEGDMGVYPHVATWINLCTQWLKETLH